MERGKSGDKKWTAYDSYRAASSVTHDGMGMCAELICVSLLMMPLDIVAT